jgi:ATP/ADP translocase
VRNVDHLIYLIVLLLYFCFIVITGATEMIYVPMSLEIRYVGKEFVRFFGQKGGKSVASVLLSGINAHMSCCLRVPKLVWGGVF